VRQVSLRVRRPFTLAVVAGTAAHHAFELGSGVGLVWQPELGLGPAAALWTAQLTGWAALAVRATRRADALLATFAGASLAGIVVHFVLWPWEAGVGGLPMLTEAAGLSSRQMPAYNAILWAWGLASVGSIAFEVPRGSRRWSLAGASCLPIFILSARHHFEWVKAQAESNPAWWNRGLR
jgi:hypothetical protein